MTSCVVSNAFGFDCPPDGTTDDAACPHFSDLPNGEGKQCDWWECGTSGKSNMDNIVFDPMMLPEGYRWSTVLITAYASMANGDIYVNGEHKLGIDAGDDNWKGQFSVPIHSVSTISVTGHISYKKAFNQARATLTAKAYYEKIPDEGENILFAHGMDSDADCWDYFTDHADKNGHKVYRTSVSPCESIIERARQLAEYINSLDVPDRSLIAVGHSMGGLDLRYIVGEGYKNFDEVLVRAAKKIKGVYTIATPHWGITEVVTEMLGCQPAGDSMSESAMRSFNEQYPYSNFKWPDSDETVPFLAYRFRCAPVCCIPHDTDCVVNTDGQTWEDAPKETNPRSGSHNDDGKGCNWELHQTDVLDDILARSQK